MVVVFFIVTKEENPSYKISWIIIILALPLFGGLFYLLWGNKRIAPSMKKKIAEFDRYAVDKTDPQNKCINDLEKEFPNLKRQVDYVYNLSGFPLWTNTKCEYYKVGEDLYESLKTELKSAKKFILLEYFIIQEGKMWDEILIILEEKLKEGVEIKIMFDDIGCIKTLPNGYETLLVEKGFEVAVFNPFRPRLNVLM
ncbi:MAG: PLDc N-terminal domain-containing protein, partial [Oscillospiraceae bacterium]